MIVGEKLKALREKRNLNQKQLAELSGVTSSTISRIESGLVSHIRFETLTRLAHAMSVPVDYLVTNSETVTVGELVRADSTARYILRGYERLSTTGREQLKNFVRFLAEQEQGEKLERHLLT